LRQSARNAQQSAIRNRPLGRPRRARGQSGDTAQREERPRTRRRLGTAARHEQNVGVG
jgi:hypothetical protein